MKSYHSYRMSGQLNSVFVQEVVIKIHVWMNLVIQSRVNTEMKSRHLWMNENGLHYPLTGNMKNKDLPLFITFSTKNKKYN